MYDLHFLDTAGNWIDVEVWGDNPNGQQPEKYARRRKHKEAFNSDNPRFLGIPHQACYDDGQLERILRPHIASIEPFQFDRSFDAVIPSTHWSNADELLAFCKKVASEAPGGVFPAEDWLRKRGRWATRNGEAYNTLAVYLRRWLGGIRNLRRLLGQEHASTQEWDTEKALREYKRFVDEHGRTPGQILGEAYGKEQRNHTTSPLLAHATRVATAVAKYVGGALEAQRRLGLKPSRTYWTAESATAACREFVEQHGVTPSQATCRRARCAPNALPEEVSNYAARLTAAYRKHVGPISRTTSAHDSKKQGPPAA